MNCRHAGWIDWPAPTRCLSAGSEISISTTMPAMSPTCTMARRIVVPQHLDAGRRAQPRKIRQRAVVVGKRRRAGLAGDPVHLRARAGIEHLLAREARGSDTMAEAESAHHHFRGIVRDVVRLRI